MIPGDASPIGHVPPLPRPIRNGNPRFGRSSNCSSKIEFGNLIRQASEGNG
jgi:hypothetical protein